MNKRTGQKPGSLVLHSPLYFCRYLNFFSTEGKIKELTKTKDSKNVACNHPLRRDNKKPEVPASNFIAMICSKRLFPHIHGQSAPCLFCRHHAAHEQLWQAGQAPASRQE